MKKVLIIIMFLTVPFLTVAQNQEVSDTKEAIKVEATVKQESISASLKAQVIDMNYKKSNDIISIKAYRKSLQIKVKEIKLC